MSCATLTTSLCPTPMSSWGVEDRCMVDGMIEFINRAPARPFFMMAWSTQTHHPYEPTPGVPLLNLLREPVPDDYDLGRYLNVLHETDRHLGRVFDVIRQSRPRRQHADCRHRRSWTGVWLSAFDLRTGPDAVPGGCARPAHVLVPARVSVDHALDDRRRPRRSGADDHGPRRTACRPRLAGA